MTFARIALGGALGSTLVLLAAAPAPAQPLLNARVTAPLAKERDCTARLLGSGRGHVLESVLAPSRGVVVARLSAAKGDWDLGVYDARTRRLVAGSAAFGATEMAEGLVKKRTRLVVQACRRHSSARRAKLDVRFFPQPAVAAEKIQMLRVRTPTSLDKQRLQALNLDLTEHGDDTHLNLVTYSDAERATLRAAGFDYDVMIADLAADDRSQRRAEALAEDVPSALPSQRSANDGYRKYADYQNDLKLLVERYPGLVRPITLAHPTLEGRPVQGVEITRNVNAEDGKPVFLNMGVHHAREWPSSEHAMEWAIELATNYGKSARTTRLVDSVRTIVVPIVNPDGFNLSRELIKEYKRKNCRVVDGQEPEPGACATGTDTRGTGFGTDPNRNYGGLWGGPGQSRSGTAETYSGAAPFSEPESRNIQQLVSSRQVVALITNHTHGNLLLRPPGVRSQGPPKDEPTYKALGDEMASHNGYASQRSYQLYDTTGTTEDWTYFATGGFGFTFEIGNYGNFHVDYQRHVINEWLGAGTAKGAGKGGNREAYYTITEHAANAEHHGQIAGRAPSGWRLRLTKEFDTATSPQPRNVIAPGVPVTDVGEPILFKDRLESTMVVPSGGRFVWDVNPSTRPLFDGRGPAGTQTDDISIAPTKPTRPGNGSESADSYEEFAFNVPHWHRNGYIEARVASDLPDVAGAPAPDYDLALYRKEADGALTELRSDRTAGAGPVTIRSIHAGPGDYVLRVVNRAAPGLDWSGVIDFLPPDAPETYRLSCERPDGTEVGARDVAVYRGKILRVNPCG